MPQAVFENADNCFQCKTTFSLFTRKHHCRKCGHTACDKCSSKTAILPNSDFKDPVRVCDPCYRDVTNPPVPEAKKAQTAPTKATSEDTFVAPPAKKVSKCTCNMPLCICPPDAEPEPAETVVEKKATPVEQGLESKNVVAKKPAYKSSFKRYGEKTYDLRGNLEEQCRDAIKNKDLAGVKQLIDAKCDANYVDKSGQTLAHMAALFDAADIVQLLIKNRANIWFANPRGESAVDVAPPSLAAKMAQWQPKSHAEKAQQ